MEQVIRILDGYGDLEKGAYLGAIASIASADKSASDEELSYIVALCEGADLSEGQIQAVRRAAMELSEEELKRCLDVLKGSELRFSLVSDLIAFAEADQLYTPEEKQSVEAISRYLGVNQEQFSLLNQFTDKAVQEAPAQAAALEQGTTQPASFLDRLGFGDKLKGAGINSSALVKGALGIVGPLLLARMFSGGRGRGVMGGGLLGGLLGGGIGRSLMGGGLMNVLGGGRGFGSTGGLLGRLLGGR